MASHSDKDLIRESAWLRIYRIGADHMYYESRFMVEDIRVSLDSIRRMWAVCHPDEAFEFAFAFSAKPRFSAEDEEILTFLMEHGSDDVCATIASRLPEHTNRDLVYRFLIDRVGKEGPYVANYLQALDLLSDKRAVATLTDVYAKQRSLIAAFGIGACPPETAREHLACCSALFRLTGSDEFATGIKDMIRHRDPSVSRRARMMYDDLNK